MKSKTSFFQIQNEKNRFRCNKCFYGLKNIMKNRQRLVLISDLSFGQTSGRLVSATNVHLTIINRAAAIDSFCRLIGD